MREIVESLPKGVIGVVVSGGLDSTVLWHYMYGICKERNQKIIPFTVPKNDGALTYASRMLEWSTKRYGDKTLHPIVINSKGVDWSKKDYQGEEVARQLIDGIKEIMDLGLAGYVYTGVNEYPPNYETLCSYHTPGPRNLSRDSDVNYRGRPVSDIVRQPFADYTKADIIKFANDLGILDEVAELSHSCVELIRGRCGECFWCKEREWGFAEAGHVDKGTN
tara:strand:- start:316 stop:978 length:663 start_codon:yes stop_codon:yes gene_type:complete